MAKDSKYKLLLTNGRFSFSGKSPIGKKELLFILLVIMMLLNEKHDEVLDIATSVGL